MTPETVFQIVNTAVLPVWLALAVFPRAVWTQRLAVALPAALVAVYAAAIALGWGRGGFGSLAGVAALFQSPWALLAGWVHYLAFDLLVGAWEARDAGERCVPAWALVPCLALTFLFGPVGWGLYLLVRTVRGRTPAAQAAPSLAART